MQLYDKVLTPRDVAERERIFEQDGVLRWTHDQVIGRGRIGISLEKLVHSVSKKQHPTTKSVHLHGNALANLLGLYTDEQYILWFDRSTSTVSIVLKQGASSHSSLKAWCQGLLLAKEAVDRKSEKKDILEDIEAIAASLERITKVFDEYACQLKAAGWDLEIAALETHSGVRLVCMH